MKEKMLPIINLLRGRSETRKKISYLALLGVNLILLGGLYLFIFESSKIVVQDLEQQKMLGLPDDAISELANLNLRLDQNHTKFIKEDKDFKQIEKVIEVDGNLSIGGGDKIDIKTNLFENQEIDLTRYSLEDFSETLHHLEGYNDYFSSQDAIGGYENFTKRVLSYYIKELKSVENIEKSYMDKYEDITDLAVLDNLILIETIEKKIALVIMQKQDILINLNSMRNGFDNELKNIDELLNNFRIKNNKAIKSLNDYKAKMLSNLKLSNDRYAKQKEIVDKIQVEQAMLEAKKKLNSIIRSPVNSATENSKTTFLISTNIARFGIIVITMFFTQIFLSIYRYSIRVSDFYGARADAIEILTQTDVFEVEDFSDLFETLANILTPNLIDFGKKSEIASDEVLKTVQSVLKKG